MVEFWFYNIYKKEKKMSGNNQQAADQFWTSSRLARNTKRNGLAIAISNNKNGESYWNMRGELANYPGVIFVVSTKLLVEEPTEPPQYYFFQFCQWTPARLERHNNTLDLFLAQATFGMAPIVEALDQCMHGTLVSKKQDTSYNWEEDFDFDMVDSSTLPLGIPTAFGLALGLTPKMETVARRLWAIENGPTDMMCDGHHKMVGEEAPNPPEDSLEILKCFPFKADDMDMLGLVDQDILEGNCYYPAPREEKFRLLNDWEKQSSPRVISSNIVAEGHWNFKEVDLDWHHGVCKESRSHAPGCNMVPKRHCDKQTNG